MTSWGCDRTTLRTSGTGNNGIIMSSSCSCYQPVHTSTWSLEVTSSEDINRSRGGSAQQRAVAVISPILCSAAGALAGYNPITMSPSQSPGSGLFSTEHHSTHPSSSQQYTHHAFTTYNQASNYNQYSQNRNRQSQMWNMNLQQEIFP